MRCEHMPGSTTIAELLDCQMNGDCGGFDLKLEESPNCGDGCSISHWDALGTYSTHLFADRAIDLIDRHSEAAARAEHEQQQQQQ